MENEKTNTEIETEILNGLIELNDKQLELKKRVSEVKPLVFDFNGEEVSYTASEFFKEFSDIFNILLPNLNTSGKATEIKEGLGVLFGDWINERGTKIIVGRKLAVTDDYRERGVSLTQSELFALLKEVDLGKALYGKDERVLKEKRAIIKKIREIIKDKDVGLKKVKDGDGKERYRLSDWEYTHDKDDRKRVKKEIEEKPFKKIIFNGYYDDVIGVIDTRATEISLDDMGNFEIIGYPINDTNIREELVEFNLKQLSESESDELEEVKDIFRIKISKEFENEIRELIKELKNKENIKEKNRKEIISELKKEFGDRLTINAI